MLEGGPFGFLVGAVWPGRDDSQQDGAQRRADVDTVTLKGFDGLCDVLGDTPSAAENLKIRSALIHRYLAISQRGWQGLALISHPSGPPARTDPVRDVATPCRPSSLHPTPMSANGSKPPSSGRVRDPHHEERWPGWAASRWTCPAAVLVAMTWQWVAAMALTLGRLR